MTAPTDKRLALDVMHLVATGGMGAGLIGPPARRRLMEDAEGLAAFVAAVGSADDGSGGGDGWDALRIHIRRQSQRLRCMEAEAVRRSLPAWREQGRLLEAMKQAAAEAPPPPAGDEEEEDEDGEAFTPPTDTEAFGGGFGY